MVDLNELLASAQLPALPQSAIRLLELSQDPENGPAEYAAPIEADPGLTGQVLRFVNSSYFGFSREISSVKLAITLVGVRTIKNFALWSAVFSLMPNPKCGALDLKVLWQDSLRRALFARVLGKQMGVKDAEDFFAAALLQDMAIPLLAKELPEHYAEMFAERQEGNVGLSQLEQDRFGWTHAAAAGVLATIWNLPGEFGDYMATHTEWESLSTSSDASPGQLAVALSALLPSGADPTWHCGPQFEAGYTQLAGAGAPPIAEFLTQTDDLFTEFAPVLKLNTTIKPLAESYAESTAPAS